MLELWNSLGCKMCKQPLEQCFPVNKTNTRRGQGRHGQVTTKCEGTFRQQLLLGARAEQLDPKPVAARCGHIYHRGCIKKLTTELNSSCAPCPLCLKPIVLNQTWPIEFYHPEKKDVAKRPKTLPNKVYNMNEKNNSLQDELIEVRRIRVHKQAEFGEIREAINRVKQSILLRRQELDAKLVQLFGAPKLDERYEEKVRAEKETILQRVKELTNRNSELLASIEERAKTHYVNEEGNIKEEMTTTTTTTTTTTLCRKSCFTPEETTTTTKNKKNEDGQKNMRQADNFLSIPTQPTHDITATRSRCVPEEPTKTTTFDDTLKKKVDESQILQTKLTQSSRNQSHSPDGCDNLLEFLKVQQTVVDGSQKARNDDDDDTKNKNDGSLVQELKNDEVASDVTLNNNNNNSSSFAALEITSSNNNNRVGGRANGKRSMYPIPMATVTRSMQELFQQEKLKYLENRSREELLKRAAASIIMEQVDKSDDDDDDDETTSDSDDGREKSSSSSSVDIVRSNVNMIKLHNNNNGGDQDNRGGVKVPLALKISSTKKLSSKSIHSESPQKSTAHHIQQHRFASSGHGDTNAAVVVGPNKASKRFSKTKKSTTCYCNHLLPPQATQTTTPQLGLQNNLKFKSSSKVSVKGKRGVKSHHQHQRHQEAQYKLTYPSMEPHVQSIQTHDFHKRQRWKRPPWKDFKIKSCNEDCINKIQ